MKKFMRRQRRNVVWTMIVCMLMHTIAPVLYAQDPDGPVPRLQKLNERAAVVDSKLAGVETRVESMRIGLNLFRANNAEISKQIKEVADGNTELETTLYDLSNLMTQIRDRQTSADADLQQIAAGLQSVSDVMKMTSDELLQVIQLNNCTRAELEQINCLLCKVNQILCTLPGDIKRAKVRAFIFGFLVGMGVSAAISGGGGTAVGVAKFW